MKIYYISIIAFLVLISEMLSGQSIVQNNDVIHNKKVVGSSVVKKIGNDQNFMITLNFSAGINFLLKKVIISGKAF